MVFSKGLLRRVLLIAGLALLLSAAVLAALPSLLKPALNRWLPGALSDNEQTIAVISQLSWTRIGIDELLLPLPDGTVIHLNDLQIRFHPSELFQGRLRTLSADSLSVTLPAPSAVKVAAAAAANAGEKARSQFNQPVSIPAFAQWLSLPAERVDIHRFSLQHPTLSADLSISLTPELWRVHGQLQVDNQPLPWNTEFQLQQSGDWLLLLAENEVLLTQTSGHIAQTEQHTMISVDQRLDLQALSQRLPQLADLPLPLHKLTLKAEVTLPNEGILPADAVLGAAATLTTHAAPLPGGVDWQQGSWLISVTKPNAEADWQLRLDSQQQQVSVSGLLDDADVQVRSQQTLTGFCTPQFSLCELEGDLNNNLTVAAQQQASLKLQPAINWQQDSALSVVLPLQLDTSSDLARALQLPLADSQLSGELIALLSPDGDWQVSTIPGFSARLQPFAVSDWQVSALTLTLLPQLYVHGNFNARDAAGKLSMEPVIVQMSPATLSQSAIADNPGSTLQLAASELQCLPEAHSQGINVRCQFDAGVDASDVNGWPLPATKISGPFTLAINDQSGEQQISADVSIRAALDKLNMRLRLEHNLISAEGNAQWYLNDTYLDWNSLQLPTMAALSKIEWLGGSVSGQGWVDWSQQADGFSFKPDLTLRADNLSAVYDSSIALENWNALISLRRPFSGDYLLDAQLSGASLNPGIELKDILARSQTRIPADFSYAVAEIHEMHTDVLGGRIHTPLIRFDSRKDINAFGIELEHIQLAQIAALEANAQVNASGTLDGLLPIVISPEGVSIPGGTLFARAPGGVIQYNNATSEALGQSDQTVGLAMQLLQNFQYEQLKNDIQYQPDGELNLGLQFQGKNPDFFGGQKTHLNVNLEYNLLDLLESLRVTQDVISRLEQKYQ